MNRNLMLLAALGGVLALAILIWLLMGEDERAGEPLSSTQVVEEVEEAGEREEVAPVPEPQPEGEAATEEGAAAPEAETSATQEQVPPVEPAAPVEPEQPALVAPSFDVVRVEQSGEAVIAGRAMPGSAVRITDNGQLLGTVESDGRGEWVFLTDAPLAPGNHELALEAERDGVNLLSENVVVVVVPEPMVAAGEPGSETPQPGSESTQPSESAPAPTPEGEAMEGPAPAVQEPLAVLTSRDGSGGGTQILQAPGSDVAPENLVLEAVDYDAEGFITVSGRGAPGDRVILYLDNVAVGQTAVSGSGRWSLQGENPVDYGLYKLRADQIGGDGKVLSRVETVFSRVEMELADLPQDQFVVVEPGNSLWVIARRLLGSGLRYSVIFEANEDQIRDPDLIYPGQIFLVPQSPSANEG